MIPIRAIFSALILTLPTGIHASGLILAEQGKSDYQIVLPDSAPDPVIEKSLAQVARLMQSAFDANGFQLSIVKESDRDAEKPGIFLGDTDFARANGVDPKAIEGWDTIHKTVGRDVIIAGREQASPGGEERPFGSELTRHRIGTAKAVADFLRLHIGTRFLYPDAAPWSNLEATTSVDWSQSAAVEFLPTATIQVPADLDRRQEMPIEYNTGYAQSAAFYDLANNRFPIVDEAYGAHTYWRAIPLDKYAKTHPEYFALIDGERLLTGHHAQYCISNPAVQALLLEDLIRIFDAGYESADIGQPDAFRACECDDCRNLYGTGDDWDEKLWILHRTLAERAQKERPGKGVNLMSYINTALPPKTFKAFPENTRIILTGTNEEDIAPWRECDVPRGFSGYLYNWTANLGTRYTPMRTPRYVEAQIKRLIDNNIQSIYRDGPGILFGLEGPVFYVMGRMLDDPQNGSARDLMHEFCEGAFGKASDAMVSFYETLYHGIELYSEYIGTRSPAWVYLDINGRSRKHLTDPFQFLGFLYTPPLLETLERDLTLAGDAAESEKVKARLTLIRREFDYIRHLAGVIHLYHAYRIEPDAASRDRLLNAIDARNAFIASLFDEKGGPKPIPGFAFPMFPPSGHAVEHLQLANDGYQEPVKDTCLNWNTEEMRKAPLP